MSSKLSDIPNGENVNWQKTIGAHKVWVKCSVSTHKIKKKRKYYMNITTSFRDMYNFNKGSKDLDLGIKDEENGRFEELGWAKSFETYGSMEHQVRWTDKKKKTTITPI